MGEAVENDVVTEPIGAAPPMFVYDFARWPKPPDAVASWVVREPETVESLARAAWVRNAASLPTRPETGSVAATGECVVSVGPAASANGKHRFPMVWSAGAGALSAVTIFDGDLAISGFGAETSHVEWLGSCAGLAALSSDPELARKVVLWSGRDLLRSLRVQIDSTPGHWDLAI